MILPIFQIRNYENSQRETAKMADAPPRLPKWQLKIFGYRLDKPKRDDRMIA